VDLDKVLVLEELAEELRDAVLNAEDGVVGGRAEVERARLQTGIELDPGKSSVLPRKLGIRSRGVLKDEW
jgi:hypothetical protein